MATSILVMILGIVSSTTLVISALSVHRFRMLSFGIATGILIALQYGLVGAMVGLVVLSIGLLRNILILVSYKVPFLNHWIWIPVFMIAHTIAFVSLNDWNHTSWISFVPLLGGYASTIALYFRNLIYTKSILITMGILWLFYQFQSAVYGQMIGEGLQLVANAAALYTLILAKVNHIPLREVEDVDVHLIDVLTHSIPVINNAHHSALNKKYPTLVRGQHPTSVGYARMVEAAELSRVN